MLNRPFADEYAAYYAAYIDRVPEGELSAILRQQMMNTVALLSGISSAQADYRYAQGKWTVKEVLGHIMDTERIMSYRLMRFARGDATPLPGYDDVAYVTEACFHERDMADLLQEFTDVRRSTLTLLRGVPTHAWSRTGTANESKLSARALAYVIAGHESHHINVLQERYELGQ